MNFVHELNTMADSWAWQAAHAAWQAALVGCVAVLFVRLATRLPAQIRYAILLVALAKFVFPPLLSVPTGVFGLVSTMETQPASEMPVNESSINANSELALGIPRQPMGSSESDASRATKTQRERDASIESSETVGSSATPSARDMLTGAIQTPLSESSNGSNLAERSSVAQGRTSQAVSKYQSAQNVLFAVSAFTWLAIVHTLGMLVCAVLLVVRLRSLHRRKQLMGDPEAQLEIIYRETAAELGVRRLPELLVSPESTGPYSFGVLRPTIVIPATCTEHLSPEAVRIVMAHELVHYRRGDLLVNAVQIAIAIVWWFHPVVWILNKSIRRIREDCCDDCLLEAGVTRASDYCQTLLDVANLCDCRRPRTGIAIGMATDKIPLATRFRRIMDERIARQSRLGWLTWLTIFLVALVVLPGVSQTSTAVAVAPQAPKNADTRLVKFTVVDERERTPLPLATDFHVLDSAGQPMVGAPLEVHLTYPSREARVSIARTDGRGVARVQWPQQRPSWISVCVKSPDYVFQSKQWNQRPIQCKVPPNHYEFKLTKGVAIGGVVSDGTNGIAGVTVNAAIVGPIGSNDYLATTGVDGRWEIPNAPVEIDQLNLQLAHDDYHSDPNQWSRRIVERDIDAMRSAEFVATMIKGEDLSGKVTDEFGVPICGVQLALFSQFPGDHALKLRSDAQGNFRFPHCPPDLDSQLVAFHPEYAPTRIPIRLQGESMVQDVELNKGSPVRFKITGPEGLPVPGVSLSLDQWSGVLNTFVWDDEFDIPETDENGNCVWLCAPQDPFTYGFYRYGWTRPRLESVYLTTVPIEVQMYPEPIVTVRAVDEQSGETVQDFKLITGEFRSTRQLKRYEAKQFTEGQAQLKISDSAHQYFVRVEAPGYAAAESELYDAKEGNIELVLKLNRTESISGVVHEPDGSLAIGATVIMGTEAARPYIRAGGETSNHDLRVTTGDDGAFSFSDPGDDFTLFVFSKNGFTHIRKQDFNAPAEIQVRPWARVEGELAQMPATGEVTGIRFELEGEPGGRSFFGPHCYFNIETTSDAQGKFNLELPGEVDGTLATAIVLGKHGGMTSMGSGPSQTLSLIAGETVHVTLGQVGRRVIGQVQLAADIDPNCRVDYGTLSLASKQRQPFKPNVKAPASHFVVDETGEFEIAGVPSGKYQFLMDAWQNSDDHRNRKMVGRFQRWITVPQHDVGQPADQEFDLGQCIIQSNDNARPQAATGASGREYFKLPRTNGVAESFDVQIHCIDSARQPVQANVKTWYGDKSGMHIETLQTNSSGEVNLKDMPTHGVWVFVSAAGFQEIGLLAGADSNRVEVELVRTEQPQPVVQHMGWERADAKYEQMAKFLLGRTVNRILEGSDEQLKFSALLLLARHDARAALDLHAKYAIDYAAIGDEQELASFTDSVIRVARSVELAADNPEATDQLLKSVKDGKDRARGYASCVAALAKADGNKLSASTWMQSWIELALESVEVEAESHWRAETLAGIARILLDMGDPSDLARGVLDKARASLDVPSDNERWYFARSMVAWELARIDVDAAMRLVQSEIDMAQTETVEIPNASAAATRDMREAERGRLLGNLAHQIALSDPRLVIHVLDACPGEFRGIYCPRVCYRIAQSDVERALALAESCRTGLARGHALGAIADALSERERGRALEILQRAFDELEKVPASEEKTHMAVSVACSLLPTVAKIDQQLLDTYKWRALAMRTAKQCHSGCRGPVCDLGLVDGTSQLRLGDGLLGATIARYDAQLGRQIAFAAGDDTLDLPIDQAPYYLFGLAYLTAPEQTVLALGKLSLDSSLQQRTALSALEQVVGLIGLDEGQRWDWLLDEQYQLWRPDKFDF